jgi:putative SOS response-associated peptidase YedK
MRYRILPRTGVEVPVQYNVFNARRDSLQSARTWKPLFGSKHAIFPFTRFYEWVSRDGKPVEISFSPDGYSGMWAASLYEEYQSEEGLIRSFAMVTDKPPVEVAAAGHDRCPVFLESRLLDHWLLPTGSSLEVLDRLLDHKERPFYSHALAA